MKEYSFEEVITRIKEGQTYKCTSCFLAIKSISKDVAGLEFKFSNNCGVMNDAKFTLVSQPVSFMEAVQAYKDGKTVRCLLGLNRIYSPIVGTPVFMRDNRDNTPSVGEILEGEWFIDED